METKYPIPSSLDKGDIRACFDLWLSYQAANGWHRSDIQKEAILMSWAHHGPDAFREALLASIANGWKNLHPTPLTPGAGSPKAVQKPEVGRQTLGIKDPGKGQVFRFKINKETL